MKNAIHFVLSKLRFSNFKAKVLFLLLFLVSISAYTQLDTQHHIPPFYGREDLAEGSGEDIYLFISTPQTTAFDVKITDGSGNELSFSPVSVSRSAPFSVALSTETGSSKGAGTKFLIPTAQLATVQTDEGLILTANKAFFTNIRVDESAQAGFLTSKGTAGFGTEFRSGHIWNTAGETGRKSHVFSFMATEDNTTVTISDFGSVDFENVSEGSGTITVPLSAGESYVMAAYADNASSANLNDVNGTRITSNRNIVVNSGSWLAGSPGGTSAGRDIGIDQIAPIEQTGFEYILVKGEGIDSENVIVVAHTDGTNIFLNGSTTPSNPSTLDAGDYFRFTASDYTANENMYLISNQPVYVYQGLNGSASTNERQLGLNYIPPIVCLGGTNVDLSDIDQLGNAVIQIIAEAGATVTIDDGTTVTDVTASAEAVTGNLNYETYKLTGYTGDITVASPRPIRVALTIESGNVGGAGFFSGFTTTPVIETPNGYDATTCIPDNLPVVLEATGFDSYQWYRDGIILTGETNPTVSVTGPGVYTAKGTISGCVSSEQSFPLIISLCPGEVGIAKNEVSTTNVSGSLFDIVFDLTVTNYSATNPAPNIQITDDITDGLPVGATASLQVPPTIESGSFSTGGLNIVFDGATDIALLDTSSSGVDTELANSSSVVIRYTLRVDMTAATTPAYTNQAIVSTAVTGPNDGITATFDNQDFSDNGTDPDPNANGNPTEVGENDVTEVCLSTTTISYNSPIYYTTGTDPTPTISGLTGGTFSAASGLTINSATGEIDVSTSIVDTYIVSYSFGGLCSTTTPVEISLNPPTEPTIVSQITNNTTPTISGSANIPSGGALTVEVDGVIYPLSGPNLSISGTTWTLVIPSGNEITPDDTYQVIAIIDDGAGGFTPNLTSGELIIDTVNPSVDIIGEPTIVSNTSPYTVTIEFSKDITGLDITDIVVGNGATSNLTTVDGNTYTVDITPDGVGDITIDIAMGIAQDDAGNGNTIATQAITIYDATPPAVPTVVSQTTNDITPVLTGTAEANSTITVVVGGATYTTTADGSGDWSIATASTPDSGTFAPNVNGTNEVVVTSTDAAGNNTSDGTTLELTIDTTDPIPTITVDAITADNIVDAMEAGTNINVTGIVGGEFNTGDTVTLVVNGVTYTGVVDVFGNYTIPITGSDLANDSDATVDTSISTTDTAGNTSTDSDTQVYTVDLDTDNDGLTDEEETTGVDDPSTPANPNGNITDPNIMDTDSDGINDGQEALDGTDPNNDCSSVGGTPLATSDCDNDGVPNASDICLGFDDNVDNDNDTIPDGCDQDDDNDGILDVEECASPGVSIVNGDFEEPIMSRGTYQLIQESRVPGWQTTATDNKIEFWRSGFLGVPAQSGNQFIELNANQVSTLFQTFTLVGAGATVTWSAYHRGRRGVEVTNILFGESLTNNQLVQEMSDGTSAWGFYSGTFIVPEGQTELLIAFQSVGGGSLGNFLDGIQIEIVQTCNDTDSDGIFDNLDNDSDGDGCPDALEGGASFGLTDIDADERLTGGIDAATGIPTAAATGQNIGSAKDDTTASGNCDNDNDGLTNGEETSGIDDPSTPADPNGNTTDPNIVDTDGDGINDGQEALDTTDPNDDCDSVGGTPIGTGDCDGDGNPNSSDPNPTVATAVDDNTTADVGVAKTINIIFNDDFLAGSTITDLGTGTATGTILIDQTTGELTYTAIASEDNNTVTINYEVCNGTVCATATVSITIPACVDTDGDNICDVNDSAPNDTCEPSTDPNWLPVGTSDCDGDGLTLDEETTGIDDPSTPANPNGNTSDPTLLDTDGDGINDGQEAIDVTNPNDSCSSMGGTPLGTADCDTDGLSNDEEVVLGTDPNNPDSDDDGINDGQEVNTDNTDPLDSCSSIGGTPSGVSDCDNDGLTKDEETTGVDDPSTPANPNGNSSDPNVVDTDGDGINDGQEALDGTNPNNDCDSIGGTPLATSDCDNDGLTNDEETTGVDDPSTPANPNGNTSDPTLLDTDGDGVNDGQEALDGTDPDDSCSSFGGTPLGTADCDNDGLTNDEETTGVNDPSTTANPNGEITNPNVADTDGDGINDGQEAIDGTDPNDDCDSVSGTPLETTDCDGDGNPNGTDPNPTIATAVNDLTTADVGVPKTIDILFNDDFLAGSVITDLGTGNAAGTITINQATGEITYTALASEDPSTVTIDYRVCNGTVCATATLFVQIPVCLDTDGDNICDALDSVPNDACEPRSNPDWRPVGTSDCDGDNLSYDDELTAGTDPNNPDTDRDGINDGQEVNTDNTNPLNDCESNGGTPLGTSDCDGDGLTNDEETTGVDDPSTLANPNNETTNPNSADTDGDGINDGKEAIDGSDPNNDCNSNRGTPLGTSDCDIDGLTNNEETTGVDDPSTLTNPNGNITDPDLADTDGDGINDGQEAIDGTDPNNDCDSIGGNPLGTSDCDRDGLTNDEENSGVNDPSTLANPNGNITDPDLADTDGDGINDGQEAIDGTDPNDDCDSIGGNPLGTSDCDRDGLTNDEETAAGTNPDVTDTDGDGLNDGEEVNNIDDSTTTESPNGASDPLNPCDPDATDSACNDRDGDGLTNDEEVALGTDPNNPDTDGDGIGDGQEVIDNTNPLDDCESNGGTALGTSDCDNDGLTNDEEATAGTNPDEADSDGDTINDGQEVNVDNTDPLNPCDSVNGIPPISAGCDNEPRNPDGISVENDLVNAENDGIFRINNIEQFLDNTVRIYNRWGVLVFDINGYNNGSNVFRGVSNGRVTISVDDELPVGVYFYVINYNDNGTTKTLNGYLYINR